MPILAFATSLGETTGDTLGITANTTAARKGPGVAEGIDFSSASWPGQRRVDFTPSSEVWISFYYKDVNSGSNSREIGLLIVGTTTLFQWGGSSINNPNLFFQYWNGSSWSTVGTASLAVDSLNKIVIHIKMDDTVGVLEYFVNGNLIGSFSGDTIRSSQTELTYLLFRSTSSSGTVMNCTYSAIIIADEDISDIEYLQTAVSGVGAETSWTGDYTAVDETGFSDLDVISSSVANNIETMTKGALSSSYNGYEVMAVGVSARAKRGPTGPQNIQLAARSGSTNGFSTTKSLNIEWSLVQNVFALNPATAAAWTFAEADAAQIGVKSIA